MAARHVLPGLAWWLLRRNRGRLWVIVICVALAVAVRASLGGAESY